MRGIKLSVAVGAVWLAATATASAACDLTISNGPQAGITEGPAGTFTSTADSAVLDVGTLTDRLSVGNANVNVGTVPCLQSGNLTVSNAVSWSSGNSLTMFGTGTLAVNAPITSTNGAAGLTVNTSQGITESASGTIDVAGPTSVQSGLSSIILTSAGNDFGQLTIPGAPGGVLLTDANAIALAGVNTGGILGLTAGAGVSQTAPLSVSGTTTITATGANVTLPHSGNSFANDINVPGAASLTINGGTGDVNLGAIVATGDLDLTAGDDINGDNNNATVSGTTTLAASNGIDAGSTSSDFVGPVSATTTGPLKLRDTNALTLGTVSSDGGDIGAGGALTQTGAITDTSEWVANANTVNLSNAGNDFNDFRGTATTVLGVRDANALEVTGFTATGAGFNAGTDLALTTPANPHSATTLALVSDSAAGSAVGPGGIDVAPNVALTSTGSPLRIYTARRSQNTIGAGATLNGATFTPGTEFVDSATEVWNTAFPAGTATNPFTIFYKQAAPVTPVEPPTPDTTLTKTPKKKTKTKAGKKKAKVKFEFTSSVAGSTFECSLDGKEASCSSPYSKKLKKGKHKFSVAATAAGKTDPTPASFDFKVKLKR